MKTFLWILLVYAGLFGIMVAVNESTRPNIPRHGHAYQHQPTIHPGKASKLNCTWECYEKTQWCTDNHVGIDQQWLRFTNIPYRAIIGALDSTGSYTMANILFLVIIIPTAILWMLIRSMEMELSIRKLARNS